MATREALLAASVLAAGALAVAAPASARDAIDAGPGGPAVSCRVAGMTGGGDDTVIRYTPDCRPMHSLDAVRRGPVVYGRTQTPTYGGGHVVGWDGGSEGGPVYAPGPSAAGASR